MTSKKASVAKIIAAVLGVLLLLSLIIPFDQVTCELTARSKAVNQMSQLSLGCRAYTADWEGEKLPPTLEALFPDYIDREDLFFAIDGGGKKIPIIYRGGDSEEEDKKGPLLEWPIPFGDIKLVANTSGHVTEERIKP